MIFVSSSASFGSDGVASTSEIFSRFSCRRSSAATSHVVELHRLLREAGDGLDVPPGSRARRALRCRR